MNVKPCENKAVNDKIFIRDQQSSVVYFRDRYEIWLSKTPVLLILQYLKKKLKLDLSRFGEYREWKTLMKDKCESRGIHMEQWDA